MRKSLSGKGVAALRPRPKRYAYPDPELRGLACILRASNPS
jgi:hypothetical protein